MKTEQEQNQILKKELERSARLTGKDVFVDAYKIITEQEKEIARLRATLKQCNTELNSALESLKSQCREIGELRAKVKQDKIDVLNKAKKCSYCDNDFMDGKWHRYVLVSDIDKLIEEVQNAEDKGWNRSAD